MVAARLNREQELACDDAVLAAGIPADAYATLLLDVARECSSSLVLGCAMAATEFVRLARTLYPFIRMAPGVECFIPAQRYCDSLVAGVDDQHLFRGEDL